MFQRNWKGIFNISKNPQNQAKKWPAWIQGFRPKWKSPQKMPFLLQTDCFHERIKFWMFQTNWNSIFNISKNPKINQKNGHHGKVRMILAKIEKSSKHADFASNWLFSWKNKILNVSDELEGYFQHFKNPKINQKNGHARSRIQRFWPKLKSPQNMPFLLQTDCFH